MSAVVFDTPGLIPLEAFTHFGVNAKPATKSPIGFFGTGLKYAIAVLVRENIPMTVWIGRHKYIFVKDEHDFRGKEFTFIALKRDKGGFFSKVVQLPFTTELGKNWKLWQAFRELYANTLDENGQAQEVEDLELLAPGQFSKREQRTTIIVESDAFAEEFKKRGEIFDLEGWEEISPGVSIKKAASRHLYYRGMRVYDMPKDVHSIYTYNITSYLELTEDRTLKNSWYAEYEIKQAIVTCHNKEVIQNILKGSDKTYEGRLDFDHIDFVPSQEFKEACYAGSAPHVYTPASVYKNWARSYIDRVAPEAPRPVDEAQVVRQALDFLDREDWYGLERLFKANRPTLRTILITYQHTLEQFEEFTEEIRDEHGRSNEAIAGSDGRD